VTIDLKACQGMLIRSKVSKDGSDRVRWTHHQKVYKIMFPERKANSSLLRNSSNFMMTGRHSVN